MAEKQDLHMGHRERMQNKLFASPESLEEHEILEILLYGCIPRQDTNPLAHKLLQIFGSLRGVLSASIADLLQINGVGKKVADHIRVMGKLSEIIGKNIAYDSRVAYSNSNKSVELLRNYFTDFAHEKFVIVLLDKDRKQIYELEFKSSYANKVFADNSEIAYAMAIHKPCFAIMAHNHTGSNPSPSDIDDISTAKLLKLCELHGVAVSDHIIFTENNYYSYFESGVLDNLKDAYGFN